MTRIGSRSAYCRTQTQTIDSCTSSRQVRHVCSCATINKSPFNENIQRTSPLDLNGYTGYLQMYLSLIATPLLVPAQQYPLYSLKI